MSHAKFWETGRKVICVARNYVAHAKELNNPIPIEPQFFLKPPSSFVLEPNPIEIPFQGCHVHHEVELGLVIGKKGRSIPVESALDYVSGYTLALDMTARCVQGKAKKAGMPWTVAKGFDTFCPISGFIDKELIPDPQDVNLKLEIDGVVKQEGNTNLMIFQIPTLLHTISKVMTLEPGDVVLTGTPEGVGPISVGQELTASIPGIAAMTFPVTLRTD